MSVVDQLSLTETIAPTVEPVTVQQAKQHVRVDKDDEDTKITDLITWARRTVEREVGVALVNTTFRMDLEYFPFEIVLPRPPLSSVTQVQYIDADGTTQTLGASIYQADTASQPGRIREADGQSWPTTGNYYRPVQVTYVAGHGAAASNVPQEYKTAMYLLIDNMYEHRGPVVTGTIASELPLSLRWILSGLGSGYVW